jgi:hypothetical protein|tara:strand:- start:93 stop:272 length:180 start_codon:yes stop_codon:yes gene_type:complete
VVALKNSRVVVGERGWRQPLGVMGLIMVMRVTVVKGVSMGVITVIEDKDSPLVKRMWLL